MLQEVNTSECSDPVRVTKREQVIKLWDEGVRDKRVIAERTGSSRNSVTVFLSRAGRLGKGHDGLKHYGVRAPTSIGEVAQERFNCSGSALIKKLVEIIDREDLYLAVLADELPSSVL